MVKVSALVSLPPLPNALPAIEDAFLPLSRGVGGFPPDLFAI